MAPHICSVLRTQAANAPDVTATFCEDRQRTGAELEARVHALRLGLQKSMGIEAGDRIALLAYNTDHFMEAFLAAAAAGAITAPVNHRWSATEAISSVASVSPKLLVLDSACAELGWRISSAIPSLQAVVCLGGNLWSRRFDTPGHLRIVMAEDMIDSELRNFQGPCDENLELREAPDGVAVICFTSGTSGQSKGAMITHTALLGQGMAKVIMAGYSSRDTYLHTAPLFHIGGLSYAVALMSVGARHVFLPRFSADGMARALKEHEITATILVPAILAQLLGSMGSADAHWPRMRSIVMGAGKATQEQLQLCQRLFPQASIHCAYGMTEAASTITSRLLCSPCSPAEDLVPEGIPSSASNCVGSPSPFAEVAIVVNGKREGIAGEEGEVWIRGFSTMVGYWGLPKETASAMMPGGWLRTGDIACKDKQGRLWLTGRLKDVIRSGSENVHAAEVEAAILAHPGICAVAVVGLPDAALGELVSCLLKLEPGWKWFVGSSSEPALSKSDFGQGSKGQCVANLQQQEQCLLNLGMLQQHCLEMGLSRYKVPRFAAGFQDDIPCNAVGKIMKHVVKEKLIRIAQTTINMQQLTSGCDSNPAGAAGRRFATSRL